MTKIYQFPDKQSGSKTTNDGGTGQAPTEKGPEATTEPELALLPIHEILLAASTCYNSGADDVGNAMLQAVIDAVKTRPSGQVAHCTLPAKFEYVYLTGSLPFALFPHASKHANPEFYSRMHAEQEAKLKAGKKLRKDRANASRVGHPPPKAPR